MTQEQRIAIFQEYFRPTKIIGYDTYYGDLSITNVGLNSSIEHNSKCFNNTGLVMDISGDSFSYGDIEAMEGSLDGEDDEDDYDAPIKNLLMGKAKNWKLVDLTILDNVNDGLHFVHLTAFRNDYAGYVAAQQRGNIEEWYAQNLCVMIYFDRNNATLLSAGNTVYLIRSLEEDDDRVSFVEVTEFVNNRKTRSFRRWFYEREKYDASWKITIYATE